MSVTDRARRCNDRAWIRYKDIENLEIEHYAQSPTRKSLTLTSILECRLPQKLTHWQTWQDIEHEEYMLQHVVLDSSRLAMGGIFWRPDLV